MSISLSENEALLRITKFSYQSVGKQIGIELAEVVAGTAPDKFFARPVCALYLEIAKPEFCFWAATQEEALSKCLSAVRLAAEQEIFDERN